MRKSRCRIWPKGLTGVFLTAVLALSSTGSPSLAAEPAVPDAPYDYQITFHAGVQGTFASDPEISVIGTDGGQRDVKIEAGADAVTVRELKAGDLVVFDPLQEGAVRMESDSPYYVRGLRRSGGDNDDEKPSAFRVERDQDYVVAYGVRGDTVSYVVQYQDRSGRTLADSRTYVGNVGDRPVIAFRYIEGYEPQAYNLTKTLSKNEAENVFTFVYSRVRTGGGSSGGGGTGGTAGGGTGAGTDTGTGTGAAAGGTGAAAGGPAGAAGAGAGQGAAAGAAGEGVADAGAAGDAGAPGVESPDGEVPADEGPRDLINLDDEETPLADVPAEQGTVKAGAVYSLPVLAALSLLLAAALAVYAGWRYRAVHKRRDDEEEEDE